MGSIQVDYDGIYSEYPSGTRMMNADSKSVADFEEEKQNILQGAISGDSKCIEILKRKYRIKCFIRKGIKII